jgi:hypothetical protein
MNKVTTLASGHITKADALRVELHQPINTPAFVLLHWPDHPSVTDIDPRGVASIAAAVVRVLAEAQARLAKVRSSRP